MKLQLLVAFILVLSTISANTVPNRRQTEKVFKTLLDNEIGRDIYASIQLELSTSSGKNVVDQILSMLYELKNQFEQNTGDAQSDMNEKQQYCGEKKQDLADQIQNIEEKIGKAQQQLPVLEEQADFKSMEVSEKQKEVDNSNAQIAAVHEKNNAAAKLYQASVQEHDDMIAALEKAKQLISQLLTSGFLQVSPSKKVNSILLQLQDHTTQTLQSLPDHQHRGIFKVLLKLAQDQSIQADQSQVADIIAIIDELIQHERETADVEQQAEQKRLERFQYDLTRATANAKQLEATIKDLQADAKTYELRAKELNFDIQQWLASLKNKKEQLEMQGKSCDDGIKGLQESLDNNQQTLALIQQVIEIFEATDIQDIKHVVDDIQYGM